MHFVPHSNSHNILLCKNICPPPPPSHYLVGYFSLKKQMSSFYGSSTTTYVCSYRPISLFLLYSRMCSTKFHLIFMEDELPVLSFFPMRPF